MRVAKGPSIKYGFNTLLYVVFVQCMLVLDEMSKNMALVAVFLDENKISNVESSLIKISLYRDHNIFGIFMLFSCVQKSQQLYRDFS